MTVLWARRRGDREYTKGPQGEKSIRQGYLLHSDDPDESIAAVVGCGLVPIFGAPHIEDYTMTCVRIIPRQRQSAPLFWDVTAEWSNNASGKNGNELDKQKDPEQQREVWKDRFVAIPQSLPCDLDGKPFVDSAGSPFDPPPTLPIYAQEISVQRYESTRSISQDRSYLNATNTDTWLDAKPGEALVTNIETEEVWVQNRWWLRRSYQILVCPFVELPGNAGFVGGYDPLRVLDAGPKVLGADGKPVPIVEAGYVDGRHVLLDGQGKRLEKVGGVLVPVRLSFRAVNKRTFKQLRLSPPY